MGETGVEGMTGTTIGGDGEMVDGGTWTLDVTDTFGSDEM